MSSETRSTDEEITSDVKDLAKALIKMTGEDPEYPGLAATPDRFHNAMTYLLRGYKMDLTEIVNDAVFPVSESTTDMVIVRDIHFSSLCEHHLLPFQGTCQIAYIPNKNVLGLSKLARITDMFAARLQIQERLGKQIAAAIDSVLSPHGVCVVIDASHTCMTMRGVEKPGSTTTTISSLGVYHTDAKMRTEFLALARSK